MSDQILEMGKVWNSKKDGILKLFCALFQHLPNDINNLGGGYLIISIQESDGQLIFPSVGLGGNTIETMQIHDERRAVM